MTENDLDKTLSILDDISLLVEVQGEAYKIRHFKYLESIKVVKILHQHRDSIPWDVINGVVGESDTDVLFDRILHCIGECGEALLEIVKMHLNKDDKWAQSLEVDEVIKLVMAIFKANADFFVKTLLPLIPRNPQNEESKR